MGWKRRIRIPLLLLVYLVYVAVITLSPFEFSIFWLKKLASLDFSELFFHFDVGDIVKNFVLFIPLGILLFDRVSSREGSGKGMRLWIPLCVGMVVSCCIETMQLFLDRSPSFYDVLANTGGTVLAYCGFAKWAKLRDSFQSVCRGLKKLPVRFTVLVVYAAALFALFVLPFRLNTFENWSGKFHLLVGNEETLNRPWEGEIFLVAVYDRALGLSEIRELNAWGLGKGPLQERNERGAVVRYVFSEGTGDTIRDVSSRGRALSLIGRGIRWLENGKGIELREGGFLRSSEPAEQLVQTLRETSQAAVEVWMRTANLVQSGPARIVSLSGSPDRRNFTLGQEGCDVVFRVRTPLTGLNGSRVRLKAEAVLERGKLHHLVATFHRGVERLVVDGQPVQEVVRGDMDFLPWLARMGRNTAARMAFVFVMFFPLGLLVFSVFRRGRFFMTLFVVGGFVSIIELIHLVAFGQPFGLEILTSVLVTALFGGAVGRAFEERMLFG